jgi:hypothetical protein
MEKNITLFDGEQAEAFAQARDLIDSEADAVGADVAERGASAGEVTDGEVVRVLAEAYLGQLTINP